MRGLQGVDLMLSLQSALPKLQLFQQVVRQSFVGRVHSWLGYMLLLLKPAQGAVCVSFSALHQSHVSGKG